MIVSLVVVIIVHNIIGWLNGVEHTLVLGDMMTIEDDLWTNPKMVRLTI